MWHLVDWIPAVLRDGDPVELPRRDSATPNPVADWAHFDDGMRAIVSRAEVMDREFAHPMAGTMAVGTAIDMLITPDVFMHSWDLARATGQPVTLDADYSAALLAGMEPVEDLLRSSGHYGQRVHCSENADAEARLIAFIGRDPHWRPDSRPGEENVQGQQRP